jgi:hypothetical protein
MIVDGRCGECSVNSAAAEVSLLRGVWVTSALELEIDAGALGQVGDGIHERKGL